MKQIFYAALLPIVLLFGSCKKNSIKSNAPLTSLLVSNTIINGQVARLNTNLRDSAAVMNYKQFTIVSDATAPVKVFASSTPNNPYYNAPLNTVNGDYFTLFLGGSVATQIDAVLVKETFKNPMDSTFNIRFVNMSPGSDPISVNLVGGANGSEVTSLAYKAVGNFKSYNGDYKNLTWSFEIRNAGTGAVIATYTFSNPANPIPRFHNVTLVFKGLSGGTGTNAQGVLRINHY